MTLQTVPVSVENGVIHVLGNMPLPQNAKALLVIVTETDTTEHPEWQSACDDYFDLVAQTINGPSLDDLSDDELNKIVHDVRQPLQ